MDSSGAEADSSHDIEKRLSLRARILISDDESDEIERLCKVDVFAELNGEMSEEEVVLSEEYMAPRLKEILSPEMLYDDIMEDNACNQELVCFHKGDGFGWFDSSDDDFDPQRPEDYGFKAVDEVGLNITEIGLLEFGTVKSGAYLVADDECFLVTDLTKSGFFGTKIFIDRSRMFQGIYAMHDLRSSFSGHTSFYPFQHFTDINPATCPWFQYTVPYQGEIISSEVEEAVQTLSPGLNFSLFIGGGVLAFKSKSNSLIFVLDQLFNSKDRISAKLTTNVTFDQRGIQKHELNGDPNVEYEPAMKCPGGCGFLARKNQIMFKHIKMNPKCKLEREERVKDFVAANPEVVQQQLQDLRQAQKDALGTTPPSSLSTTFQSKMQKTVFEAIFGFDGWRPDLDGYKQIIQSWDQYVAIMGVTGSNKNVTSRGTARRVGISKKGRGARVSLEKKQDEDETYHTVKICVPVA